MEYKCIKEMCIGKVDADGFPTGEWGIIPVGSMWFEDSTNIIGGEVHLECTSGADDFGWIEITRADLEECFEVIN